MSVKENDELGFGFAADPLQACQLLFYYED